MRIIKPRKCKSCDELFKVDRYNAWHHSYCDKAGCRKASKASSQRKWLNKSENRSYFKGAENTRRVQEWRKEHPGYWKRKKSTGEVALQDIDVAQLADNKEETTELAKTAVLPEVLALQDITANQPLVLIGLIAKFMGTTLQDDIAVTSRNLLRLGQDILAGGKSYGYQANSVPDTS